MEPTDGDADLDTRRIRLTLSRFVGGGFVAYFLVCLPEMAGDTPIVAAWWTPAAVVLAFAPGWALLAATWSRHWERVREALSVGSAVGYLVAVALWFVAWDGTTVDTERATWMVVFPGVASMALVVSSWPWTSLLHLVIATPAALYSNALGRAERFGHSYALTEVLWSMSFTVVFLVGGIMAVRTGAVLDATRRRARQVAGVAAGRRARERTRKRFDELIHDEVLAVLLTAGRDHDGPQMADRACAALKHLEDLSVQRAERILSVDEFASQLRATVAERDPGTHVSTRIQRAQDGADDLSSVVFDAMGAAMLEATRNSRRHGGDEAKVRVGIEIDSARVVVVIEDDGPGFDPSLVSADRMGVSRGICRRMRDVGGRAVIASVVGVGTRVRLEWPDPA